jgi:hypothetical protein
MRARYCQGTPVTYRRSRGLVRRSTFYPVHVEGSDFDSFRSQLKADAAERKEVGFGRR